MGRVAAILLLGWVAIGCHRISPDTLARIGDHEVAVAEFSAYVEQQVGEEAPQLVPRVMSRLLDQFLDERLVVEGAVADGLVEAGVEHRTALAALLKSAPLVEPSDDEVRRHYEAERAEYTLPERVRLAQMLIENRQRAEEALAELRRGADFAEVARRYSFDPNAPDGGLQGGQFAYADLPETFAARIFELEPGEITNVLSADFGFHIFKVTERLPGRVVPLEEAARSIRNRLREQKASAYVTEWVDEARRRYTVELYERNLPFAYQGRYGSSAPAVG
jgi:parvulin-like peptidyl-prolyl isomerase